MVITLPGFQLTRILINQKRLKKHKKQNEIILNHTPLFSSQRWQIYANTNKNITIMLVVVLLTIVSCYFRQFGKKVLIEKSFQQID